MDFVIEVLTVGGLSLGGLMAAAYTANQMW